MKSSLRGQGGFTLIELILVIVILGILAATVMGKYQDLQEEAKEAVVQGIAAELSSATKANFAKCAVNASSTSCNTIKSTNTCDTVASALLTDNGGATFSNTALSDCSGAGSIDSIHCTVSKDSHSYNATIVCTE